MDTRLVESAKLIRAAKLLHRLAMERFGEAKALLELKEIESVDVLQKEANVLFDAEGVVLEKIKAIHESLRETP